MEFSEAPFDTIEMQTGNEGQDPTASVIWLHGLGADGSDFVPIVPELELPGAVRFVFPHAPIRPITLNNGYMMRGWYDLASLQVTDGEDRAGIDNSRAAVDALVQREIKAGIPAERIVLAGFSQGGAIALHTGLRIEAPIAGIIALSTYLPLVDSLEAERSRNRPPIFMAHGKQDDIIRYDYGRATADCLTAAGYDLEWCDYPMSHSVCAEEVTAIGRWLRHRLA